MRVLVKSPNFLISEEVTEPFFRALLGDRIYQDVSARRKAMILADGTEIRFISDQEDTHYYDLLPRDHEIRMES